MTIVNPIRAVGRAAHLRRAGVVALVLAVSGLALATAAPAASARARSDAASLTTLTQGGPWAGGPGTTPVQVDPFGYAIAKGDGATVLKRYGFQYGGFNGFNNGPPVIAALAAGSINLATLGDTPAVNAKAAGQDIDAIGIVKPTVDIWLLARKGGPTTVAGLAGKKLGLQFGSNFDKYGRQVVKQAGIADQVQLVNLLIADALPALTRGDIDAYALPAANAAIWIQQQGFPIIEKASVKHPDLVGTSITVVSPSFLADHPKVQQAWWATYASGVAAIKKNPAKYLQWVAQSTGQPLPVVKQTTLLNFGTQPIDPQGEKVVEGTLSFLVSTGTAKQSFSVPDWTVKALAAKKSTS